MKRAAVIGAGSSGIAVVKAFADAGVDFDCFETSDRIGGNWVFGNKNGMSAAYEGLHINTSRDRMQFADYPMPRSYPDFPHHAQIAAYFEDYVEHFGLRRHITFETTVTHAVHEHDWRITLSTGEVRHYEWLVVANGHHWDPLWPDPPYPGTFAGRQLHAHDYRSKNELAGRRVVVVGMGNSAMDIAVEASEVAESVFLAARRGVHVIPKYMFGRPLDQFVLSPRIPWALRRRALELVHRLAVGEMERYGLPRPDHRIGDAHPTVSGRILDRLAHGAIRMKPNVAELMGDRIRFADGTVEEADVVVWCTGYKVSFPFFDETYLAAKNNDVPLFLRVFDPARENLAFVGLLQPLGAIMPIAEAQGKWLAALLRGDYALPPAAEMRAAMEADRKRMFARYVPSKRHTMQVDFDDYMLALARERRRGEVRARKGSRRSSPPSRPIRGA